MGGGSGAVSDLRGAVRASVDSNNQKSPDNQCICNREGEGGGQNWPTSTCGCSDACSDTCCYFSQPGQFDQLMSGCQCHDQTSYIFGTIKTGCATTDHSGPTSPSADSTVYGNNYWQVNRWVDKVSPTWYE